MELTNVFNIVYCLRKAPALFSEHLATVLTKKFGFRRLRSDPTYFVHDEANLDLVVRVDDPICSGDEATVDKFFSAFKEVMKFKPGATIGYEKPVNYLGDKYLRTPRGFKVQVKDGYIEDLVDKFNLATCRTVTTPATSATRPSTTEEKETWQEELNDEQRRQFRYGAGKLRFLASRRPDMLFPTKVASHALAKPTTEDMVLLKRAIRYLRGTSDAWLQLEVSLPRGQDDFVQETIYVDTDYAGDQRTRKSTTCVVALLDGMLITAYSKTQSVVATSSAEAEIYGIGSGLVEGLGIRSLLQEIGMQVHLAIRYDSSSARAMANRRGFGKMKHIDVKHLWIQDVLRQLPYVELRAVASEQNLADIGMKPLQAARLQFLGSRCGLSFTDSTETSEELYSFNSVCRRKGLAAAPTRALAKGECSGQRVDDGLKVENALSVFIIEVRDEGYNPFLRKLPSLNHRLAECQKRSICRIGHVIADQLPANELAEFVRHILTCQRGNSRLITCQFGIRRISGFTRPPFPMTALTDEELVSLVDRLTDEGFLEFVDEFAEANAQIFGMSDSDDHRYQRLFESRAESWLAERGQSPEALLAAASSGGPYPCGHGSCSGGR
ncbi:unnamed protein product [Polarella glacialis]|uniref:Reverse transcriptase Ty1/copia-type domain-containing protein n=1 Tax=Polarella glacialis TaxID=89957 RepID=A0A813FBS1_POLGL|nr:unnamed protein product [Polarella glacialis]